MNLKILSTARIQDVIDRRLFIFFFFPRKICSENDSEISTQRMNLSEISIIKIKISNIWLEYSIFCTFISCMSLKHITVVIFHETVYYFCFSVFARSLACLLAYPFASSISQLNVVCFYIRVYIDIIHMKMCTLYIIMFKYTTYGRPCNSYNKYSTACCYCCCHCLSLFAGQ